MGSYIFTALLAWACAREAVCSSSSTAEPAGTVETLQTGPIWVGATEIFTYFPVEGVHITFNVLDASANPLSTLGSIQVPGTLMQLTTPSSTLICSNQSTCFFGAYQPFYTTVYSAALNGSVWWSTNVQFGVVSIVMDSSRNRLLLGGSALAVYEVPLNGGNDSLVVDLSAYMSTGNYITNGGMVLDASQSLLYVQIALGNIFPVTGPSKLAVIDLATDAVAYVVNAAQTLGALWLQNIPSSLDGSSESQLFGYFLQYGSQPLSDPANFTVGPVDPKTGVFTSNMVPQNLPTSVQGVTSLGSIAAAPPNMTGDYTMVAMLGYAMAQNSAGAWYVAFNATGASDRPIRIITMPLVQYMQVTVV